MKKYFIVAGALVALAVPSVASATQPVAPGGFGTERAENIHTFHQGDAALINGTMGDLASSRAGDNGTINNDWKADYGYLPVESSLTTP
jgi:hypothetical protein